MAETGATDTPLGEVMPADADTSHALTHRATMGVDLGDPVASARSAPPRAIAYGAGGTPALLPGAPALDPFRLLSSRWT